MIFQQPSEDLLFLFGSLWPQLSQLRQGAGWLRSNLQQCHIEAEIPARANRCNTATYDVEKHRWRYLFENFFQKLKEFKGIAMRSCKPDFSFVALIYLAATVLGTG